MVLPVSLFFYGSERTCLMMVSGAAAPLCLLYVVLMPTWISGSRNRLCGVDFHSIAFDVEA